MKKNGHPKYHKINVIMTDGSTFETRSTYGKPGASLRLEIDPKSHHIWTGGGHKLSKGGQMARFNSRFKDFGI